MKVIYIDELGDPNWVEMGSAWYVSPSDTMWIETKTYWWMKLIGMRGKWISEHKIREANICEHVNDNHLGVL
jgi:hypothetical protein